MSNIDLLISVAKQAIYNEDVPLERMQALILPCQEAGFYDLANKLKNAVSKKQPPENVETIKAEFKATAKRLTPEEKTAVNKRWELLKRLCYKKPLSCNGRRVTLISGDDEGGAVIQYHGEKKIAAVNIFDIVVEGEAEHCQ